MSNPDVSRLSPEREAEIEARESAATVGPWTAEYESAWDELGDGGPVPYWVRGPTYTDWTDADDALIEADAEFIAHCRQDVPDLLAELAAVEAERDSARLLYEASQEALAEAMGELRECREEAEELLTAAKAASSLLRGERETDHDLVLQSPVRVHRVLRQLETALGVLHSPSIAEWETREE